MFVNQCQVGYRISSTVGYKKPDFTPKMCIMAGNLNLCLTNLITKGQSISKCPFGVFKSTKE